MGSKVYAFFFYGFFVAGMLGYFIQLYVAAKMGYEGLFWIMAGLSASTIITLKFFKENILWANL